MKTVKAHEVVIGQVLETWFGKQIVVDLLPYTGPHDFVINVIRFSSGAYISNIGTAVYSVVELEQ